MLTLPHIVFALLLALLALKGLADSLPLRGFGSLLLLLRADLCCVS